LKIYSLEIIWNWYFISSNQKRINWLSFNNRWL